MELDAIIDGRFKILEILGDGKYGEVALVKDNEANDEKALKMIPKIRTNGSPDVSHFLELNALRELQGIPGVPELFISGELENHHWFVMTKFTEDLENLRQKIPTKAFQPETVFKILWHLVKILQNVHQNGFLHQDLKLNNIMVLVSGHIVKLKLVDFGLARPFEQGVIAHTEVQVTFQNYLAPPKSVQKQPYLESEELFVVGFLACVLRNERRWVSLDPAKMLEKKIRFGENPGRYLKEENDFLIPIVKALTNQEYGAIPQYEQILAIIEDGLFAFNAPKELLFNYINGELFIN